MIECNYICFGRETGKSGLDDDNHSGTPHLQGVVRFTRTYRLPGLKKNISSRAHWEPCKDFEAAVNYCMKEDPEPFVKDNRKQGQRTDLDLACETVKTAGIFQLARDDPGMFVKYHGGFAKLATMFQTKRDSRPHVTWIYGDTGTGKTRQVHENEDSLFVAHATHQWWDGYRQQEAILIDDMRASWAPFNMLLKILDRYQMQVQVKGGFVELNSPRIYITSQFPPHEIYNREARSGEDIAQLLRRLGTVKRLQRSMIFGGATITTIQSTAELLDIDRKRQEEGVGLPLQENWRYDGSTQEKTPKVSLTASRPLSRSRWANYPPKGDTPRPHSRRQPDPCHPEGVSLQSPSFGFQAWHGSPHLPSSSEREAASSGLSLSDLALPPPVSIFQETSAQSAGRRLSISP